MNSNLYVRIICIIICSCNQIILEWRYLDIGKGLERKYQQKKFLMTYLCYEQLQNWLVWPLVGITLSKHLAHSGPGENICGNIGYHILFVLRCGRISITNPHYMTYILTYTLVTYRNMVNSIAFWTLLSHFRNYTDSFFFIWDHQHWDYSPVLVSEWISVERPRAPHWCTRTQTSKTRSKCASCAFKHMVPSCFVCNWEKCCNHPIMFS